MSASSPAIETSPGLPATVTRPARHPAIHGLASALLLWLAFPPADRGYLAWFALAPLFLCIRSPRSHLAVALGAWLGGMAFWHLAIQWVRLSDASAWLGWVIMASFLSLWWPLFALTTRWVVRRLPMPLMLVAPVVWVSLEYLRAYALTGFPWYYLAHTQYRFLPLIQIADITGVWGPSLLVALVNAWVVDLLTLPLLRPDPRGARLTRAQLARLAIVLVLVGSSLAYGSWRMATARFRPGPRLALLQSNLRQELKMNMPGEEILATFRGLIAQAVRGPDQPDLIVWPETSFPYPRLGIEPGLDDPTLEALARRVDPKVRAAEVREHHRVVEGLMRSLVERTGRPMLVGGIEIQYVADPPDRLKYNSAFLLRPGVAGVPAYRKLHLVPFGEYVPLIATFPWLTRLTPYHGDFIPSMIPGPGPSWFDLGGYRYAAAICFEDTVPQVVRRFFAEVRDGRPPDVLLNLSNDGWFHGSSELDAHLIVSVFRAIEHRVPLARAVNTGISAMVDGNGAIRRTLPKLTSGVLADVVWLDDRTSLYTAWGDWLALLGLALTIGLFLIAFRGRPRGRRDGTSGPASLPVPGS